MALLYLEHVKNNSLLSRMKHTTSRATEQWLIVDKPYVSVIIVTEIFPVSAEDPRCSERNPEYNDIRK